MTEVLLRNAYRAHERGNRNEAARLCREILRQDPRNFNALYLLSFVLSQSGQLNEAAALMAEAVKVNSASADAWYNQGVILQNLNRAGDALVCYDRALEVRTGFLDALINRGIVLLALKRREEALSSFEKAVAMKPDDSEAWNNRATALLELERPGDALASLGRALALDRKNANAWSNRGVALQRLNRNLEALESFAQALALRPDNFAAMTNRASVLMELHRHQDALKDLNHALAISPDYVEGLINRGIVLNAFKDEAGALASLNRAVELRPDSAALFARMNTLMTMKKFEEAATDCEGLLKLEPDYKYARGFLAFFKLQCCDWRDLDENRLAVRTAISEGKRVIAPFAELALSADPEEQQYCARICVEDRYPAPIHSLWQGERYDHRKIRIAYLSGDFNNTAVATLIAGVLEQHDRQRFEITALSFARSDNSPMRARLMRAAEGFTDVWAYSDGEAGALLRQMEIDIAVDLAGFTGNSRPRVLALRGAPVQVNFLGYPGTMGADYIDYIIADKFVIPREDRQYYDEMVVHLPDSYLPHDKTRKVAERTPTRAEAGLPEEGFVFCSFNNTYKFSPELFDIWMRLLRAVPKSVLWLPESNSAALRNLKREAEVHEIDPQRLKFAPFISAAEEHLARLKLADLFLDTLPYNAHTTAADALWAGLPVLTLTGTTFAGRVGTSLLNALDLPELVTNSPNEYESLAMKLATEPTVLAELKAKLKANRETQPLFNTVRFTRHLEAAYTKMCERTQRGERPTFLAVEPIPS